MGTETVSGFTPEYNLPWMSGAGMDLRPQVIQI